MNETEIQNQLRIQRGYVNDAKRMADDGYLERSAYQLAQARKCQDKISCMLLELENEGTFITMTPELMQRGMKMSNHPYAQETMKIFREGINYCARKFGESEFRRMLN